jgi:cytochrome c553
MKQIVATLTCVFAPVILTGVLAAQQQPNTAASAAGPAPPLWAFPVAPTAARGAAGAGGGRGAAPAAAPDTSPKSVPGTTVTLTPQQVRDTYNIPDWHPDGHPAMPEIVRNGRRTAIIACGYCHLPNGQGRPENSSVAGLPAEYIVQQMADFKNGLRKSSESRLGPQNLMVNIGKAATDAEVQAAADYFSKLKLKSWIRVVETATVPATRIAGGMFIALEDGTKESIGNRIIEVPEDLERTELRDDASGFIAYAPVGSIKKGEALANGGAGKATACNVCHGADLRGLGPVPSIAGRSPSQMGRQLWDMQHGARNGPWTQLMKPVVSKLSEEDIVSLTAYLASLKP